MKLLQLRRAADYGGILNAGLCLVHCAAGPVLLAWWSGTRGAQLAEGWDVGFLLVSGLLVYGATRRASAGPLRLALWGGFALFFFTVLLAGRWPWLEPVQYVASLGLLLAHLLNLHHGRRCAARAVHPPGQEHQTSAT